MSDVDEEQVITEFYQKFYESCAFVYKACRLGESLLPIPLDMREFAIHAITDILKYIDPKFVEGLEKGVEELRELIKNVR